MQQIRIINPNTYGAVHEQMKAGSFGTIDNTDFEIIGFETVPTEGYKAPDNFPNCCKFHEKVYADATDAMFNFPACCDEHKNLLNASWFNIAHYDKMPIRVLQALSHSEYHITNTIDAQDCLEDVTSYIEYCIKSFGQFPAGYGAPHGVGLYYTNLKFSINKNTALPNGKKQQLLNYIDNYFNEGDRAEAPDINILLSIYKKWLKAFPFSISLFQTARSTFENSTLPLIAGEPRYNKYIRSTARQLATRSQLITLLVDLTKQLLRTVNASQIAEQIGKPETDKHTIELIQEDLRIKNELLLGDYSNGEIKYLRVLKQWLTNHKEYFKDISKYIDNKVQPVPSKSNNIIKLFEAHGFFNLPKVRALSTNNVAKLSTLITSNKLPYQIAMMHFLGFIEHLEKEHFGSNFKLTKELAKWLGSSKDGRAIKGHINSLLPNSTENLQRYTAHLHKETVQNDYTALK